MKTSKLIKSLIPAAGLFTLSLVAVAYTPPPPKIVTVPQQSAGTAAENPLSSYEVSDDGVTKDGLTWQRCLVGQSFASGACTGEAKEFANWEAALNAVTAEQQQQGWRVANIKELVRMVETTKAYPALDSEVFPFAKNLQFAIDDGYSPLPRKPSAAYIWSSTPIAHKIVKKEGWSYTTVAKSKELTEQSRKDANQAWALDLSVGVPAFAYRDGRSSGEVDATEWSNPDPDKVIKARYVLLVKDAE